jgi:protein-disulfide isomerase
MKKIATYAILMALPFAVMAEKKDKDSGKESGITREQADEILNELRAIHQLLEKQGAEKQAPSAPAPPPKAKINLEGAPMLGSKDAPITIVEFTDYQCPYCQRFHAITYPELKKNFIDTGKVRFFSRDLPLDSLHPNATRAAQAARCAADQNQFWTMRDLISNAPDKLDLDSLVADAQTLKMDTNTFRSCVQSEKYKDAVQSDILEAMRVGADGTPAFVIGKSTPKGVDGELLVGAQPFAEFVRVISRIEGLN